MRTVRAFFDTVNRAEQKATKDLLRELECQVLAELWTERHTVGQAVLWTVLDREGRTMLWMIPENLASLERGRSFIATGYPVIWSSHKAGKRIEWLQVTALKPLEIPSRQQRARQLAQQGLIGPRPRRSWPNLAEQASVRLQMLIDPQHPAIAAISDYVAKVRRFSCQWHKINMNDPAAIAGALQATQSAGGDFLLMIGQADDAYFAFDDPAVLTALRQIKSYSILIQPGAEIRPFAYWWVDEVSENLETSLRHIVTTCWRTWKGPRDHQRAKAVAVQQAQQDRTRFATELSRLRRENSRLTKTLEKVQLSADPRRLADMEDQIAELQAQVARGEERRKALAEQLFLLEKAQAEEARKQTLLSSDPVEAKNSQGAARRKEDFRHLVLEEERDKLTAENKRLQARINELNALNVVELVAEKKQLTEALAHADERREHLGEVLFLLEQENLELRGRLQLRDEEVTFPTGDQAQAQIVVGKARLLDEIHDLLIQEEMDRLRREIKGLKDRLEKQSAATVLALQRELAASQEQGRIQARNHAEQIKRLREELRLLQRQQRFSGEIRSAELLTGEEAKEALAEEEANDEAMAAADREGLLDKTMQFLRQGFGRGLKK
ncbi:hypothetical protein [Heliophilum fasciatum]|nr:hypothetical protein [Heliophilum fasciatum]MCW2278025.1 hypothetical protein [Heliophilum fasciatum]